MTKNNIRTSLDSLNVTDVYSLMLFALYKMSDIPEYSTLSELVYTMNRESLLNFLECFGGTTIRVPTIYELKLMVNALMLYQTVNIDHVSLEDAIKYIDESENLSVNDILKVYKDMCEVLKTYDFKRR